MELNTKMMPLRVTAYAKFLPLLFGVLLASAGAYMIAYATKWGPWAGSDSVGYVEVARNIIAGKGIVFVRASGSIVPMYGHPPLYPLVLAGPLAIGLDAIGAGRSLAIFLFFCLILMPSVLGQMVKDRYILPLGITAYILTSPNLVYASTGLMSESLFMLLVILAIGLAVGSLCFQRIALLPVAASLAGLSMLTRFTGAACILVVALVPFLDNKISIKRRIFRAMSVLVIGTLPFVMWTLSVRAAGYTPGVYSLPVEKLWVALQPLRLAFVDMLWDWLPLRLLITIDSYRLKAVILLLLCTVLAWASLRLLLRAKQCFGSIDSQTFVPITGIGLLLFAAAHALVVAISFLFVTLPKPRLDLRVLLPSQSTFAIGLVLVLYSSAMHLRNPIVRLALPLVFILFSIWTGLPSTWQYVRQLNAEGWGYTSRAWQQSPIVDSIKGLSPSLTIISNDPDAVLFYAQRPAFQIPELENGRPPYAWLRFGDVPQSEPEMLFAEGRASLVLFSLGRYQFSQLYGEDAPERLSLLVGGLEILYQASDGGIYLFQNQ